jgi:hypothetical protein
MAECLYFPYFVSSAAIELFEFSVHTTYVTNRHCATVGACNIGRHRGPEFVVRVGRTKMGKEFN